MALYCGIDLHSTNSVLVVIDEMDNVVFEGRFGNSLVPILAALMPWRDALAGVVVESTYNWYWLVDGLEAEGFEVHLANPAAIDQYSGLKHRDDRSDARWLAHLLRLGLLAEGYIYPKAKRGTRDLLRRRSHLNASSGTRRARAVSQRGVGPAVIIPLGEPRDLMRTIGDGMAREVLWGVARRQGPSPDRHAASRRPGLDPDG